MDMTILKIIKAWLGEQGYDGLYNDDDEDGCGCGLDDFMPCEYPNLTSCKAGYKQSGGGYGKEKHEAINDRRN